MKKRHFIILVLFISISLIVAGCSSESTNTYIDLSPMEAKELIDSTPDIIIIDVSPFYAQGRIPGSVNYYLGDGSLDNVIPMLDKDKIYLVYCHVDSVSIAGANKLIEAGFKTVYRLAGNYSAWVNAGYPVETD
jgi:rhodanese-related sulfurtransferase